VNNDFNNRQRRLVTLNGHVWVKYFSNTVFEISNFTQILFNYFFFFFNFVSNFLDHSNVI
jgi:hypothetical protein